MKREVEEPVKEEVQDEVVKEAVKEQVQDEGVKEPVQDEGVKEAVEEPFVNEATHEDPVEHKENVDLNDLADLNYFSSLPDDMVCNFLYHIDLKIFVVVT